MVGLNHSHIVGTVYTHEAQGWSENLEELPLQNPPPFSFFNKRLSLWHNFPTDARFRVKCHKVFAHSLSSLSALWLLPTRVLCDKGACFVIGQAQYVKPRALSPRWLRKCRGSQWRCGNKLRDKYSWDQVEKQWWNRWVMQTTAALTQTFTKLDEQSHETVPIQPVLHTPQKKLRYKAANMRRRPWKWQQRPYYSKSVSNHDEQQDTKSG